MTYSHSHASQWRARLHRSQAQRNDGPQFNYHIVSQLSRPLLWLGAGAFSVALLRPVVGGIDGSGVHLRLDLMSAGVAFVLIALLCVIVEIHFSATPPSRINPGELRPITATEETHLPVPANPLSDREREVLGLLADPDLSIKEIAQRLQLSPNTIRTHERNIGEKLGAHRRWPIVEAARWQGLVVHGRSCGAS